MMGIHSLNKVHIMTTFIKAIDQYTGTVHYGKVVAETKCFITVVIKGFYGKDRPLTERVFKRDGAMYNDVCSLLFFIIETEEMAPSICMSELSIEDAHKWNATEDKFAFCLDVRGMSADDKFATETVEEMEIMYRLMLAKEAAQPSEPELAASIAIMKHKLGVDADVIASKMCALMREGGSLGFLTEGSLDKLVKKTLSPIQRNEEFTVIATKDDDGEARYSVEYHGTSYMRFETRDDTNKAYFKSIALVRSLLLLRNPNKASAVVRGDTTELVGMLRHVACAIGAKLDNLYL